MLADYDSSKAIESLFLFRAEFSWNTTIQDNNNKSSISREWKKKR